MKHLQDAIALLMLSGCLLVTGCMSNEEPLQRKCERLREHVVDLRVQGLPERDQRAHRAALSQALGDQFTDRCKTLTAAQVACALAANEVVVATECSLASSR